MSSLDDTEGTSETFALRVFKTAPPNGERGWYGSNEPQGNDQVQQLVQVRGKRNESYRSGQCKGPGGPKGNDAGSTEGETEDEVGRQVTDDVDERERAHRNTRGV